MRAGEVRACIGELGPVHGATFLLTGYISVPEAPDASKAPWRRATIVAVELAELRSDADDRPRDPAQQPVRPRRWRGVLESLRPAGPRRGGPASGSRGRVLLRTVRPDASPDAAYGLIDGHRLYRFALKKIKNLEPGMPEDPADVSLLRHLHHLLGLHVRQLLRRCLVRRSRSYHLSSAGRISGFGDRIWFEPVEPAHADAGVRLCSLGILHLFAGLAMQAVSAARTAAAWLDALIPNAGFWYMLLAGAGPISLSPMPMFAGMLRPELCGARRPWQAPSVCAVLAVHRRGRHYCSPAGRESRSPFKRLLKGALRRCTA